MSQNERQALLDAAAKLGHRIAPDGRYYRCQCGHVLAHKASSDRLEMAIELHARNAVALEGKR